MAKQRISPKKARKSRSKSRRPTPLLAERVPRTDGKGTKAVVTPAGCEVARRMQAEGCPEALLASVLGLPLATMRDAAKRQPELADAMAAGAGVLEGELVKLLMEHARGGYSPAAMFLLKSKCGYREQGPPAGQANVQVNIQIPPPMSDAEFKAIIDGTASAAPEPPALPTPRKGSVDR